MEVIYQLTPIMGLVMAVISLAFERLWVVLPPSPYFSSISHALLTVGILCVGGVIAFSMVAAEFMLIANTSALTFMVAGTLKEIVTVGSAVLFLHERFTAVNAFGLVVLVSGVVLFNFLKYQKMKQGEIRPVPLDDALECSENGDGVGPPSLLKSKNSGSMVGLPPGGNGGESFPASNGSVRSGSSQLELVAPFGASSRPPSPHTMTEASQRRVVVLQEDEDGSTAPQGSTMWRQHSI